MIDTPTVDRLALSPSLALSRPRACASSAPSSFRRSPAPFSAVLCAGGFIAAGILAGIAFDRSPNAEAQIAETMVRDRFAFYAQRPRLRRRRARHARELGRRPPEPRGRVLLAARGRGRGDALLRPGREVLTLFLGLEWFSIALYVLCALDTQREHSLEAGLKYLIVGSFGLDPASAPRWSTARPASSASGAIREAPGADDPSS